MIIIVASAFKNLLSHEYFMKVWLVCWYTRSKLSIITGVELARNFPAELVFVNNYSVNSTFSWGVFIFVKIVNERFSKHTLLEAKVPCFIFIFSPPLLNQQD